MLERIKLAVEAWRHAEGESQVAVEVLDAVWDAHLARRGPAPSEELVAKVLDLRWIANIRLRESMEALQPVLER